MNELHEQSNIVTEIPIIKISSFTRYVLLIAAILILANISIEFDIPIYRQVMGVLLLLLPGLLFVRLFNPIIKDTTEKLVLTFGICISILILMGLTLCYISGIVGISNPLSTASLLIMFDSICILFIYLLSVKKYSVIKLSLPKKRLNPYNKFFLSIAILIPIWSFWGIHMMNRYSYNILLLGLFIFVSIVIFLVSIYHKKIASNIYPIIIFAISISFLLLYPMRSDHLLGIDTHFEYYLFQQVMNNLNWQLTDNNLHRFELLWPCVSISLLPALFQSILQVNPETLYRYYIPILFSITPTIIYIIANRYLSSLESFLASVAFISYYAFFTASAYSRATLAILFFALIIMVLFNDTLHQNQRSIMLLLFSISMILTHYSSTFVFLFIFGTSSIILYLLSKTSDLNRKLTITLLISIFAMTFLWYGMITSGIFNISLRFMISMLDIDQIYSKDAHSEMVYQLKGDISNNYISELNLINTWLFLFLIVLGTLGLLLHTRYYWFESKRIDRKIFLKKEFEPEFVIIVVLCIITLAMTLILPYLSNGYDLNRIYFQISVIISVVFILGGKYAAIVIMKITNILKIKNTETNRNNHIETDKLGCIITLIVLIPHLLFGANVPHQLTGSGDMILFNSAGLTYDTIYIHDSDISCIKWWNSNKIGSHNLWADKYGAMQIMSEGQIEDCSSIEKLKKIPENDYIYLRETNIVKNQLYYNNNTMENTENFYLYEHPLNKIYSAPAAILYKDGMT